MCPSVPRPAEADWPIAGARSHHQLLIMLRVNSGNGRFVTKKHISTLVISNRSVRFGRLWLRSNSPPPCRAYPGQGPSGLTVPAPGRPSCYGTAWQAFLGSVDRRRPNRSDGLRHVLRAASGRLRGSLVDEMRGLAEGGGWGNVGGGGCRLGGHPSRRQFVGAYAWPECVRASRSICVQRLDRPGRLLPSS
jgi:hypothetical protein